MRAVFRADASLAIGTGHVMRCLTLAQALRERGASCAFVCREHPGHLGASVERLGFPVTSLPAAEGAAGPSPYAQWLGASQEQDARDTLRAMAGLQPDWVVVDHYALDAQWESQVRTGCGRLLAIDDLADRRHDCDLLLDQNLGRSAQAYAALCPPDCAILAGPAYALLRPEFAAWRARSLERRRQPALRRILVTMGGVDKDNASAVALQALAACGLPEGCRVQVILGPQAPWTEQVRALAADLPFACEVIPGTTEMARLMAESDLAIGAAGSTSWERCALGVPSILLVLADNQRGAAAALSKAGAAIVVEACPVSEDSLAIALSQVLDRPERLAQLSHRASLVCDGLGTARVVHEMWREA